MVVFTAAMSALLISAPGGGAVTVDAGAAADGGIAPVVASGGTSAATAGVPDAGLQTPTPHASQLNAATSGPSESTKFICDTVIRFGEAYAWPLIVTVLLIYFRRELREGLRTLLRRMRNARKFEAFGWKDELVEEIQGIVLQGDRLQPGPVVRNVDVHDTARATDEETDRVSPAPPGEPVRGTLVRVVAHTAERSFKSWHARTRRNFPTDRMALLSWLADEGAPQLLESYDAFVEVASKLAQAAWDTMPAPAKSEFDTHVAAYNRDHPSGG